MNISSICNGLQSVIKNITRPPFPSFSGLIMGCSLAKRPGLSTIMSTTNIIKNLGKYGIKTDDMADGEPNFLNDYTKEVVEEIYRALREDAKIQVTMSPGSIMSIGTGGNAGGPVVVNSNNINYATGDALIS